jgi:hypothetical protein
MWNRNNPNSPHALDQLSKLTFLATKLGRLVLQERLARMDSQLKAGGIPSSNVSQEYNLYAVKADKEYAATLGIRTPPLVEHEDKGDF